MRWRKVKRSLLGFWVLVLILLFKCILIFIAYDALRRLSSNTLDITPGTLFRKSFTGFSLLIFLLLMAEAFVYFVIRFRIKNKWWVRLHVWPLFVITVLMPLLGLFAVKIVVANWGPAGLRELNRYLSNIKFYSFWIIVPLCHIFFIATIVKIFTPKKEVQNDDTPPGLLDEFVN